MNRTCANCEELITAEPYEADGESFCCVGCALGGPCQCTYTAQQPTITAGANTPTTSPALAEEHATYLAAPVTAPAAEPQRLAWPAPTTAPVISPARRRPAILRIAGLTNQLDLLRLGSALEAQPEIDDISLVRADLDDAWFAVTTRDSDALADALVRVDGFDVDASPHPAGVDATVAARTVEASAVEAQIPVPPLIHTPPAAEAPASENRPRFRLFRRDDESAPAAIDAVADESQRLPGAPPPPAYAAPPAAAPAIFEPAATIIAPMEAPPAPAISQPATPTERPAAPELLSADVRPGGAVAMREHITLVAYPFRSFVALNEFQDALRGLRGVVNVKVRRFYRGTLHLGVEYEDVLPLTERMRELQGFAWRLVSSSPQEIELMLEEQGDLVSSG